MSEGIESTHYWKIKTKDMIEEMPSTETKDALQDTFEEALVRYNRAIELAQNNFRSEMRGVRRVIKIANEKQNTPS